MEARSSSANPFRGPPRKGQVTKLTGIEIDRKKTKYCLDIEQGGRTRQPFVGGKDGHENFRQSRIYKFRDKCVVFVRHRKFANLTQ